MNGEPEHPCSGGPGAIIPPADRAVKALGAGSWDVSERAGGFPPAAGCYSTRKLLSAREATTASRALGMRPRPLVQQAIEKGLSAAR